MRNRSNLLIAVGMMVMLHASEASAQQFGFDGRGNGIGFYYGQSNFGNNGYYNNPGYYNQNNGFYSQDNYGNRFYSSNYTPFSSQYGYSVPSRRGFFGNNQRIYTPSYGAPFYRPTQGYSITPITYYGYPIRR